MSERMDDLTRLVREALNRDHRSEWDTPSPDVWDSIASGLQRERRRRRLLWLVLPGLIAGGAILFFLFSDQRVMQRADETVLTDHTDAATEMATFPGNALRNEEVASTDDPAQSGDRPASDVPESKEDTGSGEVLAEPPVQTTQGALQSRQRVDAASLAGGVKATETDQASAQSTTDQSETSGDQVSDLQPVRDVPVAAPRMVAINPIARRSVLVKSTRALPIREKPSSTVTPARRWTAGLYLAPSLGTRHIVVNHGHPNLARALLKQQETPAVRAGFGLSAAYAVHRRWDIGMGIEYADFYLRSEYHKQIRFSRAGETINDEGLAESSYRVQINSSYGRIETDIVVERDQDATLREHDFIDLRLSMDQSLKLIRVPLFARYHFSMGRLRMYGQGGLTLQHLHQSTLDIRAVHSLSDQVRRVRSAHDAMPRGVNTTTLGWQLGLGVELPVGERLSLTASPVVSGSMEPLYAREVFRIFPYTYDLRIGLNWKF
ncbi:MAG: hypothetical protein R3301_05650 [Saprospiraceae bacterium]|nr:hypothetical protein [Saprospiraceae bacterium]